jgi:hypothetical protein
LANRSFTAAHGGGEIGFLKLGRRVRPAREQHGLLDAMLLQHLVPDRDLLSGLEVAVIIHVGLDGLEDLHVPGLIPGKQWSLASIPWRLQIAPDIFCALHDVTVGVDCQHRVDIRAVTWLGRGTHRLVSLAYSEARRKRTIAHTAPVRAMCCYYAQFEFSAIFG